MCPISWTSLSSYSVRCSQELLMLSLSLRQFYELPYIWIDRKFSLHDMKRHEIHEGEQSVREEILQIFRPYCLPLITDNCRVEIMPWELGYLDAYTNVFAKPWLMISERTMPDFSKCLFEGSRETPVFCLSVDILFPIYLRDKSFKSILMMSSGLHFWEKS